MPSGVSGIHPISGAQVIDLERSELPSLNKDTFPADFDGKHRAEPSPPEPHRIVLMSMPRKCSKYSTIC